MNIVFALACAKAEQLIHTALSYAPESQAIFSDDIAGKSLRISSHLPPFDVFVSCSESELFIQAVDDTQTEALAETMPADAQLSGSMPALILLAMETRGIDDTSSTDVHTSDGDNTTTYDGPVLISGDIEFIVSLRRHLQSLDIDWEAWLATLIGDIPAHLMATTARKAEHWRTQTRDRSADGLENYFRNEWPSSPWQKSAQQFTETLVTLGSDRELIDKRLKALKSQLLRFVG